MYPSASNDAEASNGCANVGGPCFPAEADCAGVFGLVTLVCDLG
jgi:hypothetical protein